MGKKKIRDKKWYIVDLTRKSRTGNYMLFNKEMDSKKQATQALKNNFPGLAFMFEVIRGDKAREFGFTFMGKRLHYHGDILKYDYPPDKLTIQGRKSFRTKYRRWKRNYKKELRRAWA